MPSLSKAKASHIHVEEFAFSLLKLYWSTIFKLSVMIACIIAAFAFFSMLPVCVTFLMKTNTQQLLWTNQHLPTNGHTMASGILQLSPTKCPEKKKQAGDLDVTWKWEGLVSWGPSVDPQGQRGWIWRKPTPPDASSQPGLPTAEQTAVPAQSYGNKGWERGGLFKMLNNTWGGVVQRWSSLGGFNTISIQFTQHNYSATFAHLFLGTASGEGEDKTPHDQLWLLRHIRPWWGLISVQVHWWNFNHWMKLQNQGQ